MEINWATLFPGNPELADTLMPTLICPGSKKKRTQKEET